MEKADDYYEAQERILNAWDVYWLPVPIQPQRLIVDPVDIFGFSLCSLPNDLMDAVKYLLSTARQGKLFINSPKSHPRTVEFRELRPYLIEKRLSAILAAKGRSNDLCPKGECIFKYSEEEDSCQGSMHVCGVCDKQVDSGTPAYTCRLCILTLHKSCAERIYSKALHFDLEVILGDYHALMREKHACKSCVDGGKGFSYDCGSCLFQTHLKRGLIPTIINHNSHPPHFLSILVTKQWFRCWACGVEERDYSYCCKPCGLYYHMKCALLPLELLKHEHGGHEHVVMKLLYSHHDTDDGMEPEESYWCEVCYEDMDPQGWLYSCKDCPYYSAHLECAAGYKYSEIHDKE